MTLIDLLLVLLLLLPVTATLRAADPPPPAGLSSPPQFSPPTQLSSPSRLSSPSQLSSISQSSPPRLLLARSYQSGLTLTDYWVSEKLDGVRAYWDGQQLISRAGNRFNAPAWFTAGLPATPLDGELWIAVGQFDRLSGTVRRQRPDDLAWRAVKFMVFDLPADDGRFDRRRQTLARLVTALRIPWLQAVRHFRVTDERQLMSRLDAVERRGGEGLMLHRGGAYYRPERSADLLKLKRYQDAEALVIRQLPGKGKYRGMMGALLVQTPAGLRFRIGSGFSDAQRQGPPPAGSIITYRYNGKTAGGKPRFARFLRIRPSL